jgi:hypothetical protein
MAKYRDFRAMAVRAAFASGSDGIVFTNTSRDTLDKEWGELSEEDRINWRDLADLLQEILHSPLTLSEPTDKNITH